MRSLLRPFSQILSPSQFQVPTAGDIGIDYSHSLANGLLGVWVPGVLGATDLTGQTADLTWGSGAVLAPGTDGQGLASTTSASGLFINTPTPYSTWSALTMFWVGMNIGVSGAFGPLMRISYANTNTSPFAVAAISIISGNIAAEVNNAGSYGSFPGPAQPGAGTRMSVAGTFLANGNMTVILYVNGALISTNGPFPGNYSISGTSIFGINYDGGVNTRFPNAICFLAAAWNRILSAAEIAWLDSDPYAFLTAGETEMSMLPTPPAIPLFLMPQIVT